MPEPGPGEIVVQIEACGLCGSDALTWYVERKAPVVLGHEPAGVVKAIGSGVTSLRVGERVFVHYHAPCMNCPHCQRQLWSNCELWRQPALEPGGFATYALVRAQTVERDTLPLPREMSFETATFIEPLACCIRAVKRQGNVQPGDTVFVVGLGAMGLLMIQLARVYGAGTIVGSDFLGERRERALLYGAQYAFDPRHEEQVAQWRELAQHRGADVVRFVRAMRGRCRAGSTRQRRERAWSALRRCRPPIPWASICRLCISRRSHGIAVIPAVPMKRARHSSC